MTSAVFSDLAPSQNVSHAAIALLLYGLFLFQYCTPISVAHSLTIADAVEA